MPKKCKKKSQLCHLTRCPFHSGGTRRRLKKKITDKRKKKNETAKDITCRKKKILQDTQSFKRMGEEVFVHNNYCTLIVKIMFFQK